MKPKILSLGEVLWDLMPSGPVLGGAPANFAIHARALGADAALVSRIGDDALGHDILNRFQANGFPTELIAVDTTAKTGVVEVQLGVDGQPVYVIHEDAAWDRLSADARSMEAAVEADAICFGSLAQRSEASREAIRRLVLATPTDALRVFDINLRQAFYSDEVLETSLEVANALKLNDTELPVLAAQFSLTGDTRAQLAQLAELFELHAVVYTRGGSGSFLLVDGVFDEHAGIATTVSDTVGAGDSFTATTVMGLLAGWPLHEINKTANEVAAFVCSQSGATPTLPEPLRARFLDPQTALAK
ncbi:MAG: carbohydrate kinase [Verrucomicrobiota bacterium]